MDNELYGFLPEGKNLYFPPHAWENEAKVFELRSVKIRSIFVRDLCRRVWIINQEAKKNMGNMAFGIAGYWVLPYSGAFYVIRDRSPQTGLWIDTWRCPEECLSTQLPPRTEEYTKDSGHTNTKQKASRSLDYGYSRLNSPLYRHFLQAITRTFTHFSLMLSLKRNSSGGKTCKHNPKAQSERKEKIMWGARKEFHIQLPSSEYNQRSFWNTWNRVSLNRRLAWQSSFPTNKHHYEARKTDNLKKNIAGFQ